MGTILLLFRLQEMDMNADWLTWLTCSIWLMCDNVEVSACAHAQSKGRYILLFVELQETRRTCCLPIRKEWSRSVL